MTFKNFAILALRLFLGGLFLYASWDKIVHPAAFSDTVNNYQLLPRVAVNFFALWLPYFEFLCGALLLIGIWTKVNAGILTAMMVMFLVAILQGVARGIDTHCGCFTQGGEGSPISIWTIVRDVCFLIATISSFVLERETKTWKLFHSA